jgi:hypothetical protein
VVSVEVDDREAELPSEVGLPRSAGGVVASVCTYRDLEEEADGLVLDVGSEVSSALPELPLEDDSGEPFNVGYFPQSPRPT